jgi:hypothetical protein
MLFALQYHPRRGAVIDLFNLWSMPHDLISSSLNQRIQGGVKT